jgi:hypothetical protein
MCSSQVRKLENGPLFGRVDVDRHFTDQAQENLYFLKYNPFAVDLNQKRIGYLVIPEPGNDRPILALREPRIARL